jgi:hypothetical protein
MPSFFARQEYDAPSAFIWPILTDFPSWPAWFPNMSQLRVLNGAKPSTGAELHATGAQDGEWSRWRIAKWSAPSLLVCEHVASNVPISAGVEGAYLQFELFDDPEGCTLEVEIGASDRGDIVGDFFVGMTLGTGARRMLPRLIDAFSRHVVERAAAGA